MENILNSLEKKLLELLEQENLQTVKEILSTMNHFDIASFFNQLDKTELTVSYNLLSKDVAAKVFAEMDIDQQKLLVEGFTNIELEEIINKLRMDDKVDLLEELPSNLVKNILRSSNHEDRAIINTMLNYPKDSAGSVMTTEYISLKPGMTASQAISHIRATAANKETINMCYVIDETRHLIGEVSLGDIILADAETPITDLLAEDLISSHTTIDREDVAHAFSKYDIVTMPIVDTENRLVGIITVDDVLDIIEEETTRDMEMMSAVTPTEKAYKQLTVTSIWKSRIPWLLFLLISSSITSFILMKYENALAKYVILSAFIPMIADTGGNAGSQSSSTIIRSLSLKEVNYSDLLYVLWKETKVAVLSGFTLGVLTFLKLMYFDKLGFNISITVALTIFFTVVIAKATGAVLPILTKKTGMDPAVMSSPLITTVVDALAIFLYLQIAILFLDIAI